MKEIQLSQGFTAMVDDSDFDYLMQFNWYTFRNESGNVVRYYAVSQSIIKGRLVFMHRLLLNPTDKLQIDHIDHN